MLKTILIASAATAAIALFADATITPARGAGIKMQTVKVKPRIPVIRPKVRVPLDTKRLVTRKKGGNGDTAERSSIAEGGPQPEPPTAPLPRRKPDRIATMGDTTSRLDEDTAREMADLKEIQDAAKQARELLEGRRFARKGLSGPFAGSLDPSGDKETETPDAAQNPFGDQGPSGPVARLGNQIDGDGVGSDIFGFLSDSHTNGQANADQGGRTAEAARNALGVTPGSIARGMAGVASGSTDGSHWFWGIPGSTYSWGHGRRTDMGNGWFRTDVFTFYRNGSREHNRSVWHEGEIPTEYYERWNADNELVHSSCSGELCTGDDKANVGTRLGEQEKPGDAGKPDGEGKPGKDVTKLYDPESTEGGGHPWHWLETSPETLREKAAGIGPGAMPGEHDQYRRRRSVQPVVTQNDLLETYDEDSRGGGAPTPIDPDGPTRY